VERSYQFYFILRKKLPRRIKIVSYEKAWRQQSALVDDMVMFSNCLF
jgi:hypothetical protein